MLYPLTFHPIFKERVWGGRRLAELYGKALPPKVPIGESWEISDRPGDTSVIANGPLAGKTVRWLMEHRGRELLGRETTPHETFPLLIKILDAQDDLSVQVHPPAHLAPKLGGAPKTEMWYVADARPGARIYAGLKRGVTREDFQKQLANGTVAEAVHEIPAHKGDSLFLPSGRVHALGAGLVIFEIQQNSDTTYRVFDWNRLGLDGKPRALHLEESLASIDFSDYEPAMSKSEFEAGMPVRSRSLVKHDLFNVDLCELEGEAKLGEGMQILAGLEGEIDLIAGETKVRLGSGQFCLVPASVPGTRVVAAKEASFLQVR